MLSEIALREHKARAINDGLAEPSSEGFFLCLQGINSDSSGDNGNGDGGGSSNSSGGDIITTIGGNGGDIAGVGGVRVVPVLGLCFPQVHPYKLHPYKLHPCKTTTL